MRNILTRFKPIPKRLTYIILALVLLGSTLYWRVGRGHAQVITFTTSGSWTVPAGVTSAVFEAWGAGGAGAGASTNSTGGGAGGGGAYAKKTLSGLNPSDNYTVTVAGVTSGSTGGGASGSSSNVLNPSSSNVVVACGGIGGSVGGSGGLGGNVSGCSIGDVQNTGGIGSNGSGASATAGAGGGGAGSGGAGGDAIGTLEGLGTSTNGGDGGHGGSGNYTGLPGNNYGGGGSGASKTNGGSRSGGGGAQGLVTITYNSPPSAPTVVLPISGSTVLTTTPKLQFRSSDADSDYLQYKVFIYNTAAITGGNCTGSSYETADQTSAQLGWSFQDAGPGGNTAYVGAPVLTSSTTAAYTIQSPLIRGNSYCWQAQAIDPTPGSNTLSSLSTASTFTINSAPASPTLLSPASGATGVSNLPDFDLKTTDADSDVLRYQVVLYDSDCASAPPPYAGVQTFDENSDAFLQTGWSGQDTSSSDTNAAYVGSSTFSGSTIAGYSNYLATLIYNHTYCWKGAAMDPDGSNTYSGFSATQTFTVMGAPTNVNIQGGVDIRGGTTVQ